MSTRNIILLIIAVIVIGSIIWVMGLPQANSKLDISISQTDRESVEKILDTANDKKITNTKPMTTAIITTNKGVITLELFSDTTPNTAENFKKLAEKGFYNSTRFHRVIKGFMIQGGDPLSKDIAKQAMWGTGDPGYKFADEISADNRNDLGTISMANSGPNTNGSQFFVNVANNNFLDTKHTVFGKVISGMEVVTAIENTKTGQNDRPIEDMVIEKIEFK